MSGEPCTKTGHEYGRRCVAALRCRIRRRDVRHAGAEPCSTLPAVRAFHETRPLSAEEAAALWPLVVLRAAVLVVSGEQQAAIDGVNDYVTGALEHERRLFERAMSVPAEVMTGLILAELGLSEYGLERFALAGNAKDWIERIGQLAELGASRLWLSTESGDLDRQIHYMKVFTEQVMPHFR